MRARGGPGTEPAESAEDDAPKGDAGKAGDAQAADTAADGAKTVDTETADAKSADPETAGTDTADAEDAVGAEAGTASGTRENRAAEPSRTDSRTEKPRKAGRTRKSAKRTKPAERTKSARRGAPEAAPRGERRRPGRLAASLRRVPRWWPLPLCIALGAAGGAVYSSATPPQYAAISYVVVSPAGRSDAASALGYAQAYGKVATDPVVLAEAEAKAKLRRGTLNDTVQATTSPDAPMVQITASSPRPKQAAKNADAVAKALARTAKASVKRTGARLTVLSDAVAPAAPVSPSSSVAVGVGGCAGGLIGGLVLLARPQRGRRPHPGDWSPAAAPGASPAHRLDEAAVSAASSADDAPSATAPAPLPAEVSGTGKRAEPVR